MEGDGCAVAFGDALVLLGAVRSRIVVGLRSQVPEANTADVASSAGGTVTASGHAVADVSAVVVENVTGATAKVDWEVGIT